MNDIVINKIQSIQRCLERVREEYNKNPDGFDSDYTLQDAANEIGIKNAHDKDRGLR